MSHEGHSGSTDAAGGGHSTIFFNAANTPLYSLAWTPTSDGAYAGTCIFLIFLAVIFRSLLALKAVMEQRWTDAELARRYVVVAGKQTFAERLSQDQSAKNMVLSANGVEENVRVVSRRSAPGVARPWRFSVDPVRACIDVVIAGVGYLLMLAVMTMNVGYFLSVLGGVFVGSLAVGRYSSTSDH
ncbi:related to Ctr copper transporter [Cephalotrichum gorgonifer]|uniref:Copper transport protein n=1 Tax=Cephalotrichum gorgonifer TaxID=2041049 RepID=A0AAE8MUB7_9PEZI|nr:related to Ctr copper transporter [Cephalotrichum gorgonifer]